jgi:xanthine/CO dehydrogenase XdhC/CoxF family maturation factor
VNGDGKTDNMNHSGASLSEFFQRHRQRHEPLVLATVARTIGSTYRKAGAQMLIARDGSAAGLLSGGCLEADLMERARTVLDTGRAMTVEYDTRSSDDVIWGIGLGCEGAMTILLTRLDEANGYEPFAFAVRCREQRSRGRFSLVIASGNPSYPLGQANRSDAAEHLPAPVIAALETKQPRAGASTLETADASFLIVPIELPPHLLLLGAGPDAMPLVEFAATLGWRVTVFDHRPAYAVAERFPGAARIQSQPAQEIARVLAAEHFDAAVVMSHHLPSDQAYLAALADSDVGYVGLLGPAPRRARLMTEIGTAGAQRLGTRLYGPIGLDIGAKTPETIALAIVSEIQAVLSGHSGGSFSHKD